MQNFVYLIGDSKTKEVAVVDPAWDATRILNEAEADGLKITAILITHYHFDHTNGILPLLKKIDAPVYLHKKELSFFAERETISALRLVEAGDTITVGKVPIQFLHTPGHTPGSQCFKVSNHLISGDTLFIDCVGRTDLPGGDPAEMYASIQNVLMKLDNDTILFPGHNYADRPTSTLGDEKAHNPYFLCQQLTDFLKLT